jgi:multidrug resistance efflux pump
MVARADLCPRQRLPRGWNVDIGTSVKAGKLLATIETPDLDQQLLQAQAELATARSNLMLAESTAKRWTHSWPKMQSRGRKPMRRPATWPPGRRQCMACRRTCSASGDATIYTPRGALRRRRHGAQYRCRRADQRRWGRGSELFVVSDIRRLRVYVQVPQRQLGASRTGSSAQINVPERAGKTYTATVQSLAQAINVASGAMLVQLDVDNAPAS